MREKFSCRCCEHIIQPPAPFHPVPRAWAGPSLLAMILIEKFGNHQPLNRQSERYALEGVELSVSTLADQVGACAHALRPLHDLIAAHVLAGERLHGDDTTVLVLAKGKTVTGRAWVYVRDDAPFGGDRPAAVFDVERDLNGRPPDARHRVRQEAVRPLVDDLQAWMRAHRAELSRHAALAKAMDYMLKRWTGFTAFLDDGRICLTNNAAERALRGLALGRKSWLLAGSDRGGQRAAVIYTLIVTAKMNGIDPQAWLADVLARIADLPQRRLPELLPWNWSLAPDQSQAA